MITISRSRKFGLSVLFCGINRGLQTATTGLLGKEESTRRTRSNDHSTRRRASLESPPEVRPMTRRERPSWPGARHSPASIVRTTAQFGAGDTYVRSHGLEWS